MRIAAVLTATTLLAGCFQSGATSDPRLLAAWKFAPPPGWRMRAEWHPPFVAPIPNVRSWSPPSGMQSVSLQVLPARRPRALRSILDPYFVKYSTVTLCHGLPALFGETRPPFGTTIADEVAAEQPGSIATASYRYDRIFAPDPAAEAALRSLCPRAR